jgi:hypothetical protein
VQRQNIGLSNILFVGRNGVDITLDLMGAYLRAVDWKVLLMWLFAWYVLPMVLGFVLASWMFVLYGEGGELRDGLGISLVLGLLWWWVIAPVGCGYTVARNAKQLPQLHVLLAVGLGFALQSLRVTATVSWLLPAWALFSVAGGAFGAYLSRLRPRKQP